MTKYLENSWRFSGEVINVNELTGEFGASIKIRGFAKRPNAFSSSVVELLCLTFPDVYFDAQKRGLKRYISISASGHVESWEKGGSLKTYFIADKIEITGGF